MTYELALSNFISNRSEKTYILRSRDNLYSKNMWSCHVWLFNYIMSYKLKVNIIKKVVLELVTISCMMSRMPWTCVLYTNPIKSLAT